MYFGAQASTPPLMLNIGDESQDYNVDVVVTIADAYGSATIDTTNIKVNATNAEFYILYQKSMCHVNYYSYMNRNN